MSAIKFTPSGAIQPLNLSYVEKPVGNWLEGFFGRALGNLLFIQLHIYFSRLCGFEIKMKPIQSNVTVTGKQITL
jgi:hypothetical protein